MKLFYCFVYWLHTIYAKLISRCRYYHWKYRFKSIGTNVSFDPFGFYNRPETISIGDNVFIGLGPHISSQGLTIGNNTMIGTDLIVEGDNHVHSVIGKTMIAVSDIRDKGVINIGQDVWIGARVTILKNVNIGEGSIIGAGSVVNKDIMPYVVAVGIPCKPKKKRFDDVELKTHLQLLGYKDNRINEILTQRNKFFNAN